MKYTYQERALWQSLFNTATEFEKVAPWRWMNDGHIFGVRNPETKEIGWCCIMGNGGQHFALGVYRGDKGLTSLQRMFETESNAHHYNPNVISVSLLQDCLSVSFEKPNMVPDWYKNQLKSLDYSFPKSKNVVHVQSMDPGLQPYEADVKEIPFLILCLQQAMDVALRFDSNKQLLPNVEKHEYLVRKKNTQGVWEDQLLVQPMDETGEGSELPLLSKAVLDRVRKLKKVKEQVLIINVVSPVPIGQPGKRAKFPVMFLALLISQDKIVSSHSCPYPNRFTELPKFILMVIDELKAIPEAFVFHDPEVAMRLEPLLSSLQITLMAIDANSPPLVELVEHFMGMLKSGPR
jgi:hypothetical protein